MSDILQRCIHYTSEHIGLSGILLIFFGLWGAWQQIEQARAIHRHQSCASISTLGILIQIFMGYVTLVYALSIVSIPMIVHGVSRIMALSTIMKGIHAYGEFSKKDSFFRIISRLSLAGMAVAAYFSPSICGTLYFSFSVASLYGSLDQLRVLWKAKATGVLDIRLQGVYLLSASAWLWYGTSIQNVFVVRMSQCFIVILIATIALWVRYAFQEWRVRIAP